MLGCPRVHFASFDLRTNCLLENTAKVSMPPSGHCNFDQTVVPDTEREHCFHKQAYVYKPNCIFFYPVGQREEVWEHNKNKAAKLYKYAEQGLV